jgi:predicted GNAT family acetyltransferase
MANILDFGDMMYTAFEPKMKNRYYMQFAGTGIPAFMVKAGNRPQLNFEKVTIDHINVKRQLKGKGEWQDLEITLYDPIVPSAAQAVMEWVRLSHESITGRDGYADFYKKEVEIYMLGPVGDKVELWKLYGAFPTVVNFGDLDAASNDVATVTMTLTYDYAILEY